jgi:hypothetical protein
MLDILMGIAVAILGNIFILAAANQMVWGT